MKTLFLQVLVLVFLAAAAAMATYRWHPLAPALYAIQELLREFDQQLLEILDTLQTATKPVVIYCGSQKCEASRHVREKLMSVVALDECYVLKGGWPAWQALEVSQ